MYVSNLGELPVIVHNSCVVDETMQWQSKILKRLRRRALVRPHIHTYIHTYLNHTYYLHKLADGIEPAKIQFQNN